MSPINTLPSDGAPGMFVLTRVGLLDRQVYAYESFKWIQKLRGYASPNESSLAQPKGKYVTFERKEAHQYSWWSARGQARAKNVGWRIDYQVVSPELKAHIGDVKIIPDPFFSDHAPVMIDYQELHDD